VLPSDLEANTIQLHQEVFEQADYSPSETVKAISSEVAYRIQSARSSNQISGETSVDTTPIQDPTQVEDPGTTVDGEGSGETPTDSSEGGGTTDPSATDPGANDSGTTGSGTTGSGTTEPGTTTTDPSGTDSDTSGSGAGTGESGGGGNVDGAGADGGTNSAPVDDDPDEQPAA
jgi:hypothetical protein